VRPDAVLLSDTLPERNALALRLKQDDALTDAKCFWLVGAESASGLPEDQLPRFDLEQIIKRMYALPSRPPPSASVQDDFRGDLGKLSVPDLLQVLSMNRRTGTLNVRVSSGAGEVRLIDGEVVDAVFQRLEAEKALYRLLTESEGSFAFLSGLPTPVRRIATPTNALLMEGMRVADEVRRRRADLAVEGDALIATATADQTASEVERRVLATLLAPRTIDELLDEVPVPDHEVLEALAQLLEDGQVRRIPKGAVRVELADPEQIAVLAALANRLRTRGYGGAVRVVLAATPRRLATLMASVRRIAGAVTAASPPPPLPVPHPLATLRLGDGAELRLIGFPAVEDYSPMWGLALGGSAVAVRLGATASDVLGDACAVAGVRLFDAEGLLGDVDEADPVQVAALLRATLDAVAGG
jgi:hypothetical protein